MNNLREKFKIIGDKSGMFFIKKVIPILPNNKLYGIQGYIEKYPKEDKDRIEIETYLKQEFKKRGLEYVE